MKFFLFFLITFSTNAVANEKRWSVLLKLIDEEEKTISAVKKKNSGLKYRLFELKTERIKIWQKKENEDYMDKSTKGIKISRAKAFKNTRSLYKKTMEYGLKIVRQHPRSQMVPATYYTLALNSRDYAQDNREYGFLQKAIKHSPHNSDINYFARTSLAEYYYNNKKYKKAVRLYEQITKNKQDEWYTKNLYNYGWCLLKTHKFDKAINTLEDAYRLSGTGSYINFQDQIMVGLTSFYVMGKQIKRGKDFILNEAQNKYDALFKFTKKVSAKGHYEESLDLLKLIPDYFDQKKGKEQLADLTLFKFDFYKQFNQKEEMFKVAQRLNKIALTKDQKEDAIHKIATEVGDQQQILKKSFDKHGQSYEIALLRKVNHYFDILANIDPQNKSKYLYFKAESHYSVQEFTMALPLYKLALEIHLKTPSEMDVKKKSMEGIFSCIEFARLTKEKELNELEYAYLKHIEIWPKTKKSQQIYPKLFSLYLSKNQLDKTQKTIDQYIESFKADRKKQQELFTVQLDKIIKMKDSNLLADKINLLNNGYLKFDQATVLKTEKILATMLFNKYQELNKKGESKLALNGYKKIFYTDKYPQAIKADAAFNMGIIYVDLLESKNAIKWFEKGLPLFTNEEKAKRRNYLETISLRASLLQDLLNAAQLKKLVLQEFCKETPKKNYQTLKQAITFDLANDYIAKSLHTFETYKKCTNQDLTQVKEQILDHLFINGHESKMISFINDHKLKTIFRDKVGQYYEQLYWKYRDSNKSLELQYVSRIKRTKCQSCKLFVKAQKEYMKFLNHIKKYKNAYIRLSTPFNPQKFNQKLNKRISSLKPLLDKGEKAIEIAHPEYSILVFEKMVEIIEMSSNEIAELDPSIEDKNFYQQFKNQMQMVARNIAGQKMAIKTRVDNLIQENNLYTAQQNKTHFAYDILQISDIRNPASSMASTLDIQE
jgi:hypothetical protein